MHQLVPFQFGVIQEAFPTSRHLAYVHPFPMSHLMFPVRSYTFYESTIFTLIVEYLAAIFLSALVLSCPASLCIDLRDPDVSVATSCAIVIILEINIAFDVFFLSLKVASLSI